MSTLVLPVKGEYFAEIKAGTKREEFRLCTPYWKKRLEGKTYDSIVVTLGYPPRTADGRRLTRAWAGWVIKTITHKHFGAAPVLVYAIDVTQEITK